MPDFTSIIQKLEKAFLKVQLEQMQNVPILNDALKVEATAFIKYKDNCLGILITPWFMNVVLLSDKPEVEQKLEIGSKQEHKFPSGSYEFTVNEVDGVGYYQSHAIYSPMMDFNNQTDAKIKADEFMTQLLMDNAQVEEGVDKERLQRFLNGEEMQDIQISEIGEKNKPLSRRDILQGKF